jgi:hypothetical protein
MQIGIAFEIVTTEPAQNRAHSLRRKIAPARRDRTASHGRAQHSETAERLGGVCAC